MASSPLCSPLFFTLHSATRLPLFLSSSSSLSSNSNNGFIIKPHNTLIRCGPRDKNRGPLVRGRTLSTEAMLAIQALKRSQSDDAKLNAIVDKTLVRLIKSDLIASLKELQRQDQWRLALKVFDAVRGEFWYKTDYSLYSEMIAMLARNGKMEEIDRLVLVLKDEEFIDDIRGLTRLVKALIAAARSKDVVEVYGLMKRGSCVPDEFMFRVLIRGLRRLGEAEVAGMVEKDFELFSDGKLKCLGQHGE